MALNKNHQTHIDTMKAYETADKNTPRNTLGGANYAMGGNGMPRTPAQQAAVKKAAQASAIARKGRSPSLGSTPAVPGVSTGSLSIAAPKGSLGAIAKPKKGLLSL